MEKYPEIKRIKEILQDYYNIRAEEADANNHINEISQGEINDLIDWIDSLEDDLEFCRMYR